MISFYLRDFSYKDFLSQRTIRQLFTGCYYSSISFKITKRFDSSKLDNVFGQSLIFSKEPECLSTLLEKKNSKLW